MQIVSAKYSVKSSGQESSQSTDILNKLINPTSKHQDMISVIVLLICPETVGHKGLRVKKNKIFKENQHCK